MALYIMSHKYIASYTAPIQSMTRGDGSTIIPQVCWPQLHLQQSLYKFSPLQSSRPRILIRFLDPTNREEYLNMIAMQLMSITMSANNPMDQSTSILGEVALTKWF